MNPASLAILENMGPISLTEMDSVRLMDRVDAKYVTNKQEVETLLRNAKAEYRVLTVESLKLSAYSTLYFDSPSYSAYLQHHNGKGNRQKFRMREYKSTGMCFMEVKHKNNKGRTQKLRIPIPQIEERFNDECLSFLESRVGAQPELLPQLWTHFSRITLVDRNCLERVTLDTDLEFRIGSQQRSIPGIVIAEVKQQSDNRGSVIRSQLRRQGIRPMRVSKYCLGISLLKPNLKSNQFKSKLRAIRKIA